MSDLYAQISIYLYEDGHSSLHSDVRKGSTATPAEVLRHARRSISDEMKALGNCPIHRHTEMHHHQGDQK